MPKVCGRCFGSKAQFWNGKWHFACSGLALSACGSDAAAPPGRGRRKAAARLPRHLGVLTMALAGGKSNPSPTQFALGIPKFLWLIQQFIQPNHCRSLLERGHTVLSHILHLVPSAGFVLNVNAPAQGQSPCSKAAFPFSYFLFIFSMESKFYMERFEGRARRRASRHQPWFLACWI